MAGVVLPDLVETLVLYRLQLVRSDEFPSLARVYDGAMPGPDAALGDVYWVYRNVTEKPWTFGEKTSRPCGCVAARRFDLTTWTALPRLSSGTTADDLPSPAMPQIRLDKAGAWSLRWIHQVRKDKTGGEACEFLGALPDDERERLVDFYRNRYNDPRGRVR